MVILFGRGLYVVWLWLFTLLYSLGMCLYVYAYLYIFLIPLKKMHKELTCKCLVLQARGRKNVSEKNGETCTVGKPRALSSLARRPVASLLLQRRRWASAAGGPQNTRAHGA